MIYAYANQDIMLYIIMHYIYDMFHRITDV